MTDRSAKWAQPRDGHLFAASSREAALDLPGLTVVSRKGSSAVEGAMAMGSGAHLASRPRALPDNTRPKWPSRKRPGELKLYPKQAGNTVFVAPDLVEGTLRRGYEILDSLTTPPNRERSLPS